MSISIKRCGAGVVVMVLLLLTCGRVDAQTTTSSADQSVNNLPQQVKTNGENKLVAKTNTVSNNAADKVDTLGTKAFKGFVGMFKKKKKTEANPGGGTPPPSGTTPPSGTPPPPGMDTTTHKHG